MIGTSLDLSGPVAAFGKHSRRSCEPFHRLKYSFAATYHDQSRLAAPRLAKLHRPDPQAGRQADGRAVRDEDGPAPVPGEASQPLRFWANKYKASFSEDPTVLSVYGDVIIDLLAKAAQKAGPNLSTDSVIEAMDSLTVAPDMFGSPQTTFTATKRLGNDCIKP